ncbi:MAG TPA: NAD(P)H-binding protein [Streptosporangiaceae bacterium]
MSRILVTGGTGLLGRAIVRRLTGKADIRVLSRRAAQVDGAETVRGDLVTGEGLPTAVDGVDVIVHCASYNRDYLHPERDTEATRRLVDAARAGGAAPHVVYISIVGADRIPFRYYRAKVAGERVIVESGLPWTILRATQFHEFVLALLIRGAKGPLAIVPRGFRAQPVEVDEVADRMVGLALGEPAGRVPDLGGPRVERLDDLMRAYLAAVRARKPVVPLPLPGRTAGGFRAGGNLLTDGVTGSRTFAEFLRSSVRPDGTVADPYGPGGR